VEDHDDIRSDIAAYVAGHLDQAGRDRLDAHLALCGECSELVSTANEIAAALRSRGDDLLSDHPTELALREHALGRPDRLDDRITRHLETCASCSLEVSAVGTGPVASPATRPVNAVRNAGVPWGIGSAAIAAALVTGLLLGLILSPRQHKTHEPDSTLTTARATGPVDLWILAGRSRGTGAPPIFRPDPSRLFVVIACPVVLPHAPLDRDLYKIIIRRQGESVWSSQISAGQIRQQMESAEAVTMIVPSGVLGPGQYELILLRRDQADARPVLQTSFQVSAT
jgi:putative zinc finger protein